MDNDVTTRNNDLSALGVNRKDGSSIENTGLSLENYNPEGNLPIDIWDSSIATAPCNSEYESSTESFDSSDSASLSDLDGNPILIASEGFPLEPDRGGPGWRYTIEPEYELGTQIGYTTNVDEAYAQDGTPLKPMRCPPGTTKSCCTDESYTACWTHPLNAQLCKYARNLFCCEKIPERGGPGVGCQTMIWVYRRSRSRKIPKDPPAEQPKRLQGVFDIFQFPDLSPNSNPSSCPAPGPNRP